MATSDDLERYCNELSSTPFFKDYDPSELERLVEATESVTLASREALWAIRTPGDSAYILIDGGLEEIRHYPPDNKRVGQIDETGAILGLSYLVEDWDHESATTAVERTELLRLRRQTFRQMFEDGDTAAYRLVDRIAEQLVREMRDANDRMHDVFGNPAETLRTLRRRVRTT